MAGGLRVTQRGDCFSQRRAERQGLGRLNEAFRGYPSTFEVKGDDGAKLAMELLFGQCVLRVIFKSRIVNLLDPGLFC